MPEFASLMVFTAVALGLVLTPGPNMMYLISRSVCQGERTGFISLAGVVVGFFLYILRATFDTTALVPAVPHAYNASCLCGVVCLFYLMWQVAKPGGWPVFAVRDLLTNNGRRLFLMGFLTSPANPKIVILYLSLLPQFITPGLGSAFSQSLILGCTQVVVSMVVSGMVILLAGQVALFPGRRSGWQ